MPEDDDDGAPEDLTGEDFVEHEKKKQEAKEKRSQEEKPKPTEQGQNIRTSYIPKQQQERRDLNRKLRDQQKEKAEKEQEKKDFETKHPYLVKGIKAGKKAVEVLNKKTAGFIEDNRKSDQKLKEVIREIDRGFADEEPTSPRPIKKKKFKNRIVNEDEAYVLEEEEELPESPRKKSTKQENFWDRNYQPIFAGASLKLGKKQMAGNIKSSGVPSTHPEIGGSGLGVYIPVGNPKSLSLHMGTPNKSTGPGKLTKIVHATGKIQKIKAPAPIKVASSNLFSIGNFKPIAIPNTSIRIKSLSTTTKKK